MLSVCQCLSLKDQDCVELWMKYELLTANLSHDLCEQLRMILEPTRASQLK